MAFDPIYSSDNIWRGDDLERCLTVDLDNIESNITELSDELSSKVNKVAGKDLSTNDYTTNEKEKLAGVEVGAQKNTITGIKGNAESTYRTGNVNITPANIGAAASNHNHSAANITSGTVNSDRLPTVPITKGGTGATSVSGILTNLGNIGKTYIVNPSNVSVPQNGNFTAIASITLPKGTYVVVGNNQWTIDSTGTIYVVRICKDNNNVYCANRGFMDAGGGITSVAIIDLATETTIKYEVYHTRSETTTASGIHFSAVKIK